MRSLLKTAAAMLFATATVTAASADAPTGYTDENRFNTPDGAVMDWDALRGKAVLLVNVASRCGFTKQYEGLQDLADAYQDKPFVVLGVPSNDFGGQTPESDAEYKEFCEVNFSRPITFPHTAKVSVKGKHAHPFYAWARESFGDAAEPKWNFHKLLINGNGQVVGAFGSRTTPDDDKLLAAIEATIPTG